MNLEAEMRDLAARRDIQKAIFDYMRRQDRLDPDLQMRALHADSDVDCGLLRGGPEAHIDWARKDAPSDAFMAGMPLIHLPGRRGTDFSQTRDRASGISGR
ncbi:hypothetical protein U5A82_11060 [Sphingobium sp. CR2-8]|uniref:hypothetical protein n=1 Tax=Sphingobium sp. CR2-8 TaxID=1306534 RepID=UPI002DC02A16|nr:hypothetical protein [Sphingobium sp. CR2-8]MEC3910990.1 hypothetical protein [Sphingobium sp. CR2-8]